MVRYGEKMLRDQKRDQKNKALVPFWSPSVSIEVEKIGKASC